MLVIFGDELQQTTKTSKAQMQRMTMLSESKLENQLSMLQIISHSKTTILSHMQQIYYTRSTVTKNIITWSIHDSPNLAIQERGQENSSQQINILFHGFKRHFPREISQDEFTSIVQHQYLWHPHKVKFITTSLPLIAVTWKKKNKS